ncbi:DNA-binding SCF ubiquitin ligase subunit DIA2 KNAG_0L02010 [Huiozyma naganishii CBS 8797]|uniref:F-box domain-containing protein n=1 Tax=Huiozyma naganishii (strain ATCC MYA-139 / BCRC 22969 / CBS 8797 / KCTC 17520 / NBRC 10181 / NCYC 3082 / Yp74L-3) TaxID=1071383 RepID=J7RD60_HUIN7|nr:hypothetical protein KNAG_0L02010 [Kazachstania naganishii CBS 8797]CCK72820.1 hypothetical protein KNAG_0L02010 [Kazachstania naganishii CBS 8797]
MSGSVDKALTVGTSYFRNGQYREAKLLFSKAICVVNGYSADEVSRFRADSGLVTLPETRHLHPKYTKLLDNLCACYEKLDQCPKALRIADKMIQRDQFNMKCYIRRGKLLQKLGDDLAAYHNYKRALNKSTECSRKYDIDSPQRYIVMINDQLTAIKQRLKPPAQAKSTKRQFIDPIQEHQTELEQLKKVKLSSIKEVKQSQIMLAAETVDFIAALPIEVLALVLQGFTTAELIKLLPVSKTYYKRILSLYFLFDEFNLDSLTTKSIRQFLSIFHRIFKRRLLLPQPPVLSTVKFSSKTASEEEKLLEQLAQSLQFFACHKLILTVPNSNTYSLCKLLPDGDNFCPSVKELSLMTSIRSDKPYEIKLLNRFPYLRKLETVFDTSLVPIRSSFNGSNNNGIPDLISNWSPQIEQIKIICNKRKVQCFPLGAIIQKLTLRPQLAKLCVTGVTFNNEMAGFQWLLKFPNLQELWFEDNSNGKLVNFLKLVRNERVFNGQLKKLTFREDMANGAIELDENMESFCYRENFGKLTHLDLMSSCINGTGLFRLLSVVSPEVFRSLNIGDCPYIQLHRLPDPMNTNIFPILQFCHRFTGLQELTLALSGSLNDNSMTFLIEQVSNLTHLEKLDLSMNPWISGVSIYEFTMKLFEARNKIPLDYMCIDGCIAVSHITVNTIKSRGFVSQLGCVYEREVWKRFGLNSYKYG